MFTYLTDSVYTLNWGESLLEMPNWVPGVHDKVPLMIGGAILPFWILDETLMGIYLLLNTICVHVFKNESINQ